MSEEINRTIVLDLLFMEGEAVEHVITGERGIVTGWRFTNFVPDGEYLVELDTQRRDYYPKHVLKLSEKSFMQKIGLRK